MDVKVKQRLIGALVLGALAVIFIPMIVIGPETRGAADAVEELLHRDLLAAHQRLDLFPDPARLFLAIPMADQPDLLALRHLGPQRLAEPPGISRNHPRRGGKDMRG